MNKCRLCENDVIEFSDDKFKICMTCNSVQRIELPTPEKEKARYDFHNNDVNDKGYLSFLSPATNYILQNFHKESIGLDFGSGTISGVSKVLLENNYKIRSYDPFYVNNPELLEKKYDYIVCTETAEHFHHPKKEFALLKSLINDSGILILMTDLFSEKTNFKNWYYKNDFTHVMFYSKETFDWIKHRFEFKSLEIMGRLIILKS